MNNGCEWPYTHTHARRHSSPGNAGTGGNLIRGRFECATDSPNHAHTHTHTPSADTRSSETALGNVWPPRDLPLDRGTHFISVGLTLNECPPPPPAGGRIGAGGGHVSLVYVNINTETVFHALQAPGMGLVDATMGSCRVVLVVWW
ncbi:hypothetical protein ZHAS_00021089 [Anopheles sinensis]|uniref:Uncharacterized protein n=1 Tax=Anopheles sinensis TaxID=74873 RepID=A0A084WRB5_ANOSI|nr:hypothetical protein ZHAS_00021089 [Anopheles sinensis]